MFDWESGINLISKCVSKEQNWTSMTELPAFGDSEFPFPARTQEGANRRKLLQSFLL